MLAACEPAVHVASRQVVVDWPEQRLVFVADTRLGRVQSFRSGSGALLAQTSPIGRSPLRDIRLEPTQDKLWVLAGDGVYLYAARALALRQSFPLESRKVAALAIEAGRVVLLDKTGTSIGQIDSETLVASWRAPLSG